VSAIDIDTFEACYNIIGKYPEAWAPKTRETADHSLPYCTAAALMDGDVYLHTFDEARFTDEAWVAIAGWREAVETMPFIRALADGSLPRCA